MTNREYPYDYTTDPAHHSWIVRTLNRIFSFKNIVNCDRDIYLRRWYMIRTKWLAVFIHKFERSDEDRALHDHPWPFLVIPLWRGYTEHSDTFRALDTTKDTLLEGDQFIYPGGDDWLTMGKPYEGIKNERLVKETFIPGYRYQRVTHRKARVLPIIGARFRNADYRHRVELIPCDDPRGADSESDCPTCQGRGVKPSWSLFVRFRECKPWGFWTSTGFVKWNIWWKEHCE